MQRAIAAKTVSHAQTGLMVGGLIKYLMAIIIIIPGIALYGVLGDTLSEPDLAFPYIVKTYLPNGLKGIILCGLFASIMSTIDSTFNSIATLWSTDIYSAIINKNASDKQKIAAGRKAIIFSLGTALLMGVILLYLKFDNPDSAFTHTLNNLRYYINCGIVVLICSAVILVKPNPNKILIIFLITLPLNMGIQFLYPSMNYFIRAFFVIIIGLTLSIIFSKNKLNPIFSLFIPANQINKFWGWILAFSLLLIHISFH